MAIYSITDLEKLTGIKAHTIRIWEKRFNIVQPKRTQTNIRYYDDFDLKKITNVALLNHKGYKISSISSMQEYQIEDLVAQMTDVAFFNADSLDALSLSIIQLDHDKFLHIINRHIDQEGFDQTFDQLLMPLLDKLNDLWLAGSIRKVHEEFAMQSIKRRIIHQIIQLEGQAKEKEGRFIVSMQGQENQHLSRFFVEYLLARNGIASLYMSNDSDLKDLLEAAQTFKAKYMLSFINEESTMPAIQELALAIRQMEQPIQLILIGYLAGEVCQQFPEVVCIQDYGHLKKLIAAI
ncbi:MAG: MerR family transcriptional regulator [Saprospiraceae bacterium]|nr:MerR family transcriptional regulator [Saprospiraceae bacterium]